MSVVWWCAVRKSRSMCVCISVIARVADVFSSYFIVEAHTVNFSHTARAGSTVLAEASSSTGGPSRALPSALRRRTSSTVPASRPRLAPRPGPVWDEPRQPIAARKRSGLFFIPK